MLNRQREKGQGLLEYALIIVLVVIVVIVILTLLGPAVAHMYSNVIEIVWKYRAGFISTSLTHLATAKQISEYSQPSHDDLVRAVFPSTDSTAGSAVYLGAGIELRFQAIEPTYEPILKGFEPNRLTSRDELLMDLKSAITPYGDKYVEMIDGSEAAIHFETPDSFSQAAHSMRDCFQKSIEHLAPSKVVSSQPWFEFTEGAPGGISRRSRIRYILYGSGQNVDEKKIQELDDLAEITKNSLDLVQGRAHDHDPTLTEEEVLLAIDQARSALLTLLQLYQNRRSKSST